MPEKHAFYVRGDDGEEYGPVDLAELREWVGENRVGLGTTVRLDEPGALWQPWQYHSELVALLASMRAAGTMEGPPEVVAPYGRRFLAGVADLILNFILMVPMLLLLYPLIPDDVLAQANQFYESFLQGGAAQPLPQYPLWLVLLVDGMWYGILVLYYTGFHAAHGRTPAKSILQLQVVDAQGRKPTLVKSLLRTLIFVASLFLSGVPLLYIFISPQRRALHDIVAGTYVVQM